MALNAFKFEVVLILYGLKRGILIQIRDEGKTIEDSIAPYLEALKTLRPYPAGESLMFCVFGITAGQTINKNHPMLFVSKAEVMKNLEKPNNDYTREQSVRFMGGFCGYPKCCIDAYLKDLSVVEQQTRYSSIPAAKRFLEQCKASNLPSLGITVDEEKDIVDFTSVVPYVPCSPSCRDTLTSVDEIRTLIKENPHVAEAFKNSGLRLD